MSLERPEHEPGVLPQPSQTVVQALKSIHPGLTVIRSKWALNYQSCKPHKNLKTGKPQIRPRYWVCLENHKGRNHVLFPVEDEKRNFLPLDMRTVARIKNDIGFQARSDAEAARMVEEKEEQYKQQLEKDSKERRRRWAENNKQALRDAQRSVEEGRLSTGPKVRDEKIFSYSKQTNKTSGKSNIVLSNEEFGLEFE